jgi:hypothetical protein
MNSSESYCMFHRISINEAGSEFYFVTMIPLLYNLPMPFTPRMKFLLLFIFVSHDRPYFFFHSEK